MCVGCVSVHMCACGGCRVGGGVGMWLVLKWW